MADIFDPSLDNVEVEVPHNRIKRNEEVNLTAWDPSMKNLLIGVGWELLAFDGNPIDLDVSCFLLNKNEKTRVDSDFVFYNNTEGCNRAVIHNGDNRTGAGDGDDETMFIKLNDIPFEVLRLVFVLSIYRGDEKESYLSKLRNCYIRVVNQDNNQEVCRYEIDEDVVGKKETAMLAASLNREGPKWHFMALGQFVPGGLPKVAKSYDIIVQGG
jgi:tellurium resistance protein TerD